MTETAKCIPVSSEHALLFDAANEFSDCESQKCNLMIYGLKAQVPMPKHQCSGCRG